MTEQERKAFVADRIERKGSRADRKARLEAEAARVREEERQRREAVKAEAAIYFRRMYGVEVGA